MENESHNSEPPSFEAPRFETGLAHFDSQDYFEAHEVWESLWLTEVGERHFFLQGLIQVAVAMHHAQNKNFRGTRKLLASSLNYLEKGKHANEPVDLKALLDCIADFELSLQVLDKGEPCELNFFKMPLQSK